ncbi:hypothetical protein SDC9_191816 [bioreactor metagenome]|uniref:Uncharacterized protein n=1 Tax=bioreactor metagenome TaxID=1076179 RepID=A0A645I776_9ZZZZ
MCMHGQRDQLEHQRPDHHHAEKCHRHGQRIGAEHAPHIAAVKAGIGRHDGAAHQERHDAGHEKRKDKWCVAPVQLQRRKS